MKKQLLTPPVPGLVWHPLHRMWYGPDGDHPSILKEVRRTWTALAPEQNDIVLDAGGHIGSFTCWAARDCKARHVHTYEASPETFKILQANAKIAAREGGVSVVVNNAALTNFNGTVDLFLTARHDGGKGLASGSASIYTKGGERTPVKTKAKSFADVMRELRPTIIKMDIEGAESMLPLMDEDVMQSVRKIGIELHLKTKETRVFCHEFYEHYVRKLGWQLLSGEPVLYEPGFSMAECKYWHVNPVLRRPA